MLMFFFACWLSQALDYKLGVVSTGNSLDHVEADDAQMAANGACREGISHGCLPVPSRTSTMTASTQNRQTPR